MKTIDELKDEYAVSGSEGTEADYLYAKTGEALSLFAKNIKPQQAQVASVKLTLSLYEWLIRYIMGKEGEEMVPQIMEAFVKHYRFMDRMVSYEAMLASTPKKKLTVVKNV